MGGVRFSDLQVLRGAPPRLSHHSQIQEAGERRRRSGQAAAMDSMSQVYDALIVVRARAADGWPRSLPGEG